MDQTPREPLMAWRFVRTYSVRIVIGVVLVAAIYFAISVYATYQREQRIAKEIEALNGRAFFDCCGPIWIPEAIQLKLRCVFCRVIYVLFHDGTVNVSVLRDLESLTNLESLAFSRTNLTDAESEHLKGLTRLKRLDLESTDSTAEGRALLRKALPNCTITPDP